MPGAHRGRGGGGVLGCWDLISLITDLMGSSKKD